LKFPRLILASASPRRQSLLREAGFDFLVAPADLDESALSARVNLSPDDLPAYLARAKAEAVAPKFPADVVLAADTIVALDKYILGKPADVEDARRILSLLSGTTHRVITGLAIVCSDPPTCFSETVSSTVRMRALTHADIDSYVATGDWQGKAGAYGIQDADTFVSRTEGCLTNIVGLPITTTTKLLAKAGIYPLT
jgi:septum formation protein